MLPRLVARRTSWNGLVGLVATLTVLACPALALGCPDCRTARLARASVFNPYFWTHLAMISLPLLVLGAIAALLYRLGLEPPLESAKTRRTTA